ncbi:MAG: class I SAM-dependent methyltransferase [Pseudonocardiaceae bacterium]|nr:class I SAM-dependent methyltransferase [Pseudonocardiaceae bacterium]
MTAEKVTLTEEKETLLATLYGRALDSKTKDPILGDRSAADAVGRIDYDFRKAKITPFTAAGVAMRAKLLDDWTVKFLVEHPEATVLHLACGLDTRVERLAPAPIVRWYDVDYPEVIELRERLYPKRDNYQMIGSSVTAEGWLEQLPADRPVVVVAEGLSMYLTESDGKRLIQRITGHFPSGQLLFDAYNLRGIKMQNRIPAVRNAGAKLHWAINDPTELERLHPSLRCVTAISGFNVPGREKLPLRYQLGVRLVGLIPAIKNISKLLRYRF